MKTLTVLMVLGLVGAYGMLMRDLFDSWTALVVCTLKGVGGLVVLFAAIFLIVRYAP